MTAWCVASSVGYIFTSKLLKQDVSPFFLCFSLFFCAALFFILCNSYRLSSLVALCVKQPNNILAINFTTLGCWLFSLFPLKYLQPSVTNTVVLGVTPLATLIIGKWFYKKGIITRTDKLISAVIFLLIVLLSFFTIEHGAKSFNVKTILPYLAYFAALLAGCCLALNNIVAKNLSLSGFKPFDILSLRFILIIVVSAIFSWNKLGHLNGDIVISLVLVSTCLVIVPQILLQFSIMYLEPLSIAIFAPFLPITILFIEVYYGIPISIGAMSIIFIISALLIVGILIRYKNEKTP